MRKILKRLFKRLGFIPPEIYNQMIEEIIKAIEKKYCIIERKD